MFFEQVFIRPPPTDVVWIGFKGMPKFDAVISPQVITCAFDMLFLCIYVPVHVRSTLSPSFQFSVFTFSNDTFFFLYLRSENLL